MKSSTASRMFAVAIAAAGVGLGVGIWREEQAFQRMSEACDQLTTGRDLKDICRNATDYRDQLCRVAARTSTSCQPGHVVPTPRVLMEDTWLGRNVICPYEYDYCSGVVMAHYPVLRHRFGH